MRLRKIGVRCHRPAITIQEVTLKYRILLIGIGVAMVGCTGTRGELEQGAFTYACVGVSDPVCDDVSLFDAHEIPKAFAVGSKFKLDYNADVGTVGTVEAASADLLSGSDAGSFTALKPGTVALLARKGINIVDLIHVRLFDPARVEVDAVAPDNQAISADIVALTLKEGTVTYLRSMSLGEGEEALAGALSCMWTAGDETVVSFDNVIADNRIQLRAVKVGVTTVQVQLGPKSAKIDITVVSDTSGAGGAGGGGGAGGAGGGGGMP
jgi:hypothetical protein